MSGLWRGGVRVLGSGAVRSAGVGRRVCCCDVPWLVGGRGLGWGKGGLLEKRKWVGIRDTALPINSMNQIILVPLELKAEDRK